jgi:hypothetical protein
LNAQISTALLSLKSKGLGFEQDPTDMFYLWREARLRDPDGHEIGCIARVITGSIRREGQVLTVNSLYRGWGCR